MFFRLIPEAQTRWGGGCINAIHLRTFVLIIVLSYAGVQLLKEVRLL